MLPGAACQRNPKKRNPGKPDLPYLYFYKSAELDTVKSIRSAITNILNASAKAEWKSAVYGGLVELASSFKEMGFEKYGDSIRLWRDAVKSEFSESTEYRLLVDIFDILVRMNTGEPQSILELRLEQRRLLVSEQEEEALLATKRPVG